MILLVLEVRAIKRKREKVTHRIWRLGREFWCLQRRWVRDQGIFRVLEVVVVVCVVVLEGVQRDLGVCVPRAKLPRARHMQVPELNSDCRLGKQRPPQRQSGHSVLAGSGDGPGKQRDKGQLVFIFSNPIYRRF